MSPLCGVRAIYILAMCISSSVFDFHWPPMLEIGRWTRNVFTWVVWAPCTVGLVAGDTQCWPGACPTDGIYIGFGFRSGFGVLWFGLCSADRGAVLHTSRPLHCRGVCEISLWSVGYVLSRSASDFVGFRVWSGCRWWDRRQSWENCTCTLILMTKISFYFLFLFWISVVRLLHYVMSCWQ